MAQPCTARGCQEHAAARDRGRGRGFHRATYQPGRGERWRAWLVDEQGRRRVVRNGHGPGGSLQTGIGPIAVRRPKVRDRGASPSARIRFTSAVLPAYLRRTKNVEDLLPWLYLKGISTGQFEEALAALLGADAPGLSATTVR